MNNTSKIFPLMLFAALIFCLSSCSLQEEPGINAPNPQLVQSNDQVIFCQECDNGCVVGHEFTNGDPFGSHPQGGYILAAYVGDCECQRNGSTYDVSVGSNAVAHITMIGGPASGSIPDPMLNAAHEFGFHCQNSGGSGGGPMGNIQVGQPWNNFTQQVQNAGLNNPGLVAWPDDWFISLTQPSAGGDILVELPGGSQSQSLEEIRVLDLPGLNLVASLEANGEDEYLLDLSELPVGFYDVQLQFEQGFTLNTAIARFDQ